MSLATDIKDYYFSHLDQLPQDKQFHFASRLSAWSNDVDAEALLAKFRQEFTDYNSTSDVFNDYIAQTLASPPKAKINASHLRQEYLDKYPDLRGLDFVLFKVRHALSIYGIDLRSALATVVKKTDLTELATTLTADKQAIRILSTYAVNYYYLLEILFNITLLKPSEYLEIARGYNLDDSAELQLYIYLYTHCIIGASNFYLEQPPSEALEAYKTMLLELERLIDTHYININLDNKLEFLVCARICHFDSKLTKRIYEECSQSISEDGLFLVDRHNTNTQSDKRSLADSEHRNVLFIMSCSPYHS